MKIPLILTAICTVWLAASAVVAAAPEVAVFETGQWSTPANAVDASVSNVMAKHGLQMRKPCSDQVFIRRVYLDLIGTLPRPAEVTAFLNDQRPDKRVRLIDSLFNRDEFADYWAMKWSDTLRVKSEYPINLWPNAVQTYHRWIHDSIRDNMPYDKFARTLLTANGSNFLDPPSNFYRALQGRDPASIAKAAVLTFMGSRTEKWTPAQRTNIAAFFSRVAYKKTDEWKEEIVYLDPASLKPIKTAFPDGTAVTVTPDKDPRAVFANWLTAPNNKWFARSVVNRIWYWTMGRGIIEEPDDIRADNPPASPEVLACLEKTLVDSHYDLRSVYKLILNSHTYQQSSIPDNDTSDPKVQFAHYKIRRLDAEVLIDALSWIGGQGPGYTSPTPEPYTFIPKDQRTIALADGSITSSFLATFGRPSRDTGLASERNNNPSDSQLLYLLNSTDIQKKIENSPLLRDTGARKRNVQATVNNIYLVILSRYPSAAEMASARTYLASGRTQPAQAATDLAWALINSKEFLYRH